MNSKTILGISIAAVFAVSILTTTAFAGGALDFLTVKKASLDANDEKLKKAVIHTFGKIPKKGDTALGYLVATEGFVNNGDHFVATTRHPGVLDSAKQRGNIMSGVWHNHYATASGTGNCGDDPQITSLSHESPGFVHVASKKVSFGHIPLDPEGPLHFGLVPNEVRQFPTGGALPVFGTFLLEPIFDEDGDGDLLFVCVRNLTLYDVDGNAI